MDADFNIYNYIEGLTGFVFDKSVIQRIALDRGVNEITEYSALTTQMKDLLLADVLYTAYCSPNVMATVTNQHGSFSQTIGSQTINRDELYRIFMGIYRRYGEEEKVEGIAGRVTWINEKY